MRIAQRAERIEPFYVMEVAKAASMLASQVAHTSDPMIFLNIGEPDFTAPPLVQEAATRAIRQGDTQYTQATGLMALREKISDWYASRFQVDVAPGRIIITAGASAALQLACLALIEAGDAHHTHLQWLTWRRWLDEHAAPKLEAKRWLYFNYAYQMVQAALTGQGVVLARMPLIAESLASGDLVEPLPHMRLDSPMAYWLVVGPRSMARPEVAAFCEWLKVQAALTRQAIGDVPDPDTVDHFD